MSCLAEIGFIPWFSREEWHDIQAHTPEYFQFVRYDDIRPLGGKKDRVGRVNLVTREVMWADPGFVISVKQILIATLGNPLSLVGRISYHSAMIVLKPIKSTVLAICAMIRDLCAFEISKVIFEDFRDKFLVEIVEEVSYRILEIMRCVFFQIGIEFAAIFGVLFNPLKARKMIQILEKKINHDQPIERTSQDSPTQFYAYPCLQPWIDHVDNQAREYFIVEVGPKASSLTVNPKLRDEPDYLGLPFLPCFC